MIISDFSDLVNKSSFLPTEIKFNFAEVRKEELHSCWDSIQRELLRTLKYSPEKNICSGDVYISLVNESAKLYLVKTFTGKYVGFFIVQLVKDVLSLWLVGSNTPNTIDDISKMVFNVARHNKCSKIIASSTRPGMKRVIERFAMKPVLITYEVEI